MIRSRSEIAAKEPRFHLRTSRAMRNGSTSPAGVAELADALDSKSSTRKSVWVRTPPPALSPAILTRRPSLSKADPLGLLILEILEAETVRSLGDLGVGRISFRPMSGQMAAHSLRNPDQRLPVLNHRR
jgi:hypothetical protein